MGKYTITMVFGTYAVNALYDEGINAAKKADELGDGVVVQKDFETVQEMKAYLEGVDDMDGWEKYAVIDNNGNY